MKIATNVSYTSGGEQIQVYRDFPEAEAAWRALAAKSACYVFQTYDWLSLWHNTSGQSERVEPFIACVAGGDGEIRAIFPLGIRHRYGCRILEFLGGNVTDYNAPLIDPAFASLCAEGGIQRIWKQLVELSQADAVWLRRMPERLPDAANPMVGQMAARHFENAHLADPLPTAFSAFAATRSSCYFSDTRRKRRKLERLGPVMFEMARSMQDADRIVDLMLRQKRRRADETGSRVLSPQHERFYHALARATFADGRPHVSRLRVGEEIVATHVGVVHQSRFYYLMPGYQADQWTRYSVGRILLQSLVEWCIAEGIRVFDLTVGDEEYKRFWADTHLKLYQSRYPLRIKGGGYLAATWLKVAAQRSTPYRALVSARLGQRPLRDTGRSGSIPTKIISSLEQAKPASSPP